VLILGFKVKITTSLTIINQLYLPMFVQDNNKQDNNNQNQQNSDTNQTLSENQAGGDSVQSVQSEQPVQNQQTNQQAQPSQPSQLVQSSQPGNVAPQADQTADQTQEDYVNSYEPPPKQVDEVDQTQTAEQLQQLRQSEESQRSEQAQSPQEPQQPREPQQASQPPESQQSAQPSELQQSQPSEKNQTNEAVQKNLVSEKLEDQNIFFLLGVEDGTTEEKERFLDELQQVVWEDFLENDLELLITTQEKERVDQILNNADLSDLDKQEQVLNYLSNLIPDLEEIMLEKALELKQEMVKERVEGMRQYYADKEEVLGKIDQAAQMFAQGKWSSGAKLLNQVV
jgi:hypothetical protein